MFVWLLGGRKDYFQTLKALIYGSTPGLLISWIPIIGFIGTLWTLILVTFGIQELQEMSTGRAVAAVILAIVIIMSIIILIAALFFMPFFKSGVSSSSDAGPLPVMVKDPNKVHDIHSLYTDMAKIPGLVVVLSLLIPLITAGCVDTAADAREWNEKGETDHVMGRYNEAVAAYDQAVTLDPAYGKAWRNRGLSLSFLNRTDESEESYQKALMIDPQEMEALYYQAVSRAYAGNTPGALESLNMTVVITPKNRDDAIVLTQAYTLRGDLLTKSDRIEEANQSYRLAHEAMMSTI